MHYDYDLVEGIFTDTAEYTEKAAFFREQFFKAGFYGDDLEYVAAVRYGEIPEAGRSKNWASGDLEQGVSVIDIVRKKSDYDKSTIYDIQLGLQGIKKYEVHGWYLGRHGADGEPLLLFPEIIREL